jgi:hypothetical protein
MWIKLPGTFMYSFLYEHVFISLAYIPRSIIKESNEIFMFSFIRSFLCVFQDNWIRLHSFLFSFLSSFLSLSIYIFVESGSHYLAQDGLPLEILLLQRPQHYMHLLFNNALLKSLSHLGIRRRVSLYVPIYCSTMPYWSHSVTWE